MHLDQNHILELFEALDAHLETISESVSIVVVGGASLAMQGVIQRTTEDVDVIARINSEGELHPASPFSQGFMQAISKVARDFGLDKNWLNCVIDNQWKTGLPPGMSNDISWTDFGHLKVGMVGRAGLIPLKLFAVVDSEPGSKHWNDLLKLNPSVEELDNASSWVSTQDASTLFQSMLNEVVHELRTALGIN